MISLSGLLIGIYHEISSLLNALKSLRFCQEHLESFLVVPLLLEQLDHVHLFRHEATSFRLGLSLTLLLAANGDCWHPGEQVVAQVWPSTPLKHRLACIKLLSHYSDMLALRLVLFHLIQLADHKVVERLEVPYPHERAKDPSKDAHETTEGRKAVQDCEARPRVVNCIQVHFN